MAYWGYHLILDCSGCSHEDITDPNVIADFAKRLVEGIDMVAYGEPQVVNFGSGNKAGYTLVQLIETSNITAHFVEETNDLYLDVFSCKPFEPKDVMSVLGDSFSPVKSETRFLVRQAPL